MESIAISRPADGVLLVTLQRPKRLNALSRQLLAELAAALNVAATDETIGAVVLTGDRRAFSTGADIKEMPESDTPPFVDPARVTTWKTAEHFPKPLIAAVEGYALGGGLELMLLCDIAIAGESAKLGAPEIDLGMFPGDGGTQRLPRAIGKGRSMLMILTGKPVVAATAAAWGLVTEVVADGQTVDRAVEIAGIIATKSPLAVRYAKEDLVMGAEKMWDEGASLERKLRLWQGDTRKARVQAFTERSGTRRSKE